MNSVQEARLERMLAKDEIREILTRLARGTDRCDLMLIQSCYHDDAYDDHGGFQGGGDAFAKWAVDMLTTSFKATMHSLGNIDIRVEGEVAYSETYCTAHHVMFPDENGVTKDSVMGLRYVDRFERRNKTWLIANRVCVYDWTYVIAADEAWPLDPPYTTGNQTRHDPSYALLGIEVKGTR